MDNNVDCAEIIHLRAAIYEIFTKDEIKNKKA